MTLPFSSPIRENVIDHKSLNLTSDFLEWSASLLGKWELITSTINGTQIESPASINFENQEDQAAYLLRYPDPYSLLDSIALYRRVMPTIIANEIIGVSPMTGPVSQIFTLRAKYSSDNL